MLTRLRPTACLTWPSRCNQRKTRTIMLPVAAVSIAAVDLTHTKEFDPSYIQTAEVQLEHHADDGIVHGFNVDTYKQALHSRDMGRALMVTPSISSTQEFMRQHTSTLPEGAVLIAEQQVSGKGRGGNQWTSPAGCLMFTMLRRLQLQGAQAPFLNYVVCLAVLKGIKACAAQWLGQGPASQLGIRIKWPNDIYYGSFKIGGILLHTSFQEGRFCLLTGIGLNLANKEPTTCINDILVQKLQDAGQQEAALTATIPKEALLASILTQLEQGLDSFAEHGFAPQEQQYLDCWLHSEQAVTLEDPSAGPVQLVIKGLTSSGFLLAVDELGVRYELTPDGNSLDMMQGLIRRKLPGWLSGAQ